MIRYAGFALIPLGLFAMAVLTPSLAIGAELRLGILGGGNSTVYAGDTPPDGSFKSRRSHQLGGVVDVVLSPTVVLSGQVMSMTRTPVIEIEIDKENPDLDEIRDIVDDIIADDKRAGSVIHGLRAMFNRDETLPGAARVNDAIRLVSEILTGELRTNNVKLETELAQKLPAVFGDEVQIQQVLMNLILNAMHAMSDTPDHARRIVVRTVPADGEILISVADTGPGISADALPRLFEPYYTMQQDGLGVGLAICRRIVERHSGRIWAEANSDAGATFKFALPMKRDTDENPA